MGSFAASSAVPRRGVTRVLVAGVRFGNSWVRRRAELGMAPAAFARALLSAARPHFFVLPAAACLAGAAASPGVARGPGVAVAAVAVGVAWSVGQLLNDLVDLEADAVDAPERPAVRGLLPEGPTALAASLLGLLVALALALTHRLGWLMALASALLMLAYSPAKALPFLGNLAHAALMAWLAFIGAAAAAPDAPLLEVAAHTWRMLLAVGALAALYLQGNYEKDRAGDTRAGYRALAHWLGVRGSALLRAGSGGLLYWAGHRAGLVSAGARWLWLLSAALLALSVARSLLEGGRRGALAGYRFTVHSTVTALTALAWPLIGSAGALGLLAAATLLVELAFARSENP